MLPRVRGGVQRHRYRSTLNVYHVCHAVGRGVKDGSCFSSSLDKWDILLSQQMLDANKHIRADFVFFQEDIWCTCDALCMQQSPTAAALSTSFLLNHILPTVTSWTHWLQDLGSHTAAWLWAVSQKDWRNQGATGWILAMHWHNIWVKKMRFSCFPVLPGGAGAHTIWNGTVKRPLIAYFFGNISAKISKCVHVCQTYSKPKVGRF